jgi:hypothetical protein
MSTIDTTDPNPTKIAKIRQPNRITVVEQFYYQQPTEQPLSITSKGFTKFIYSDDQPYQRTITMPPDTVQMIDKGWLTKVGVIHILNKNTPLSFNPNIDPNQLEPCLELCVFISLSEREEARRTMYDAKQVNRLVPIARLCPGEPYRFECCDFDLLRLVNHTAEDIKVSITLLPR